ncbi:sensor histidine kinase [Nocardioides campestrisoli]|uniref:sensor histidine kinase n=1 Tax=Nocardioides campestrisoli TaxID=2736757 RepID=UPI00163D74AE|nr:HAMP domain-containing sensor histidine kinase [Nocardioides campestrisoli]
MEGVGLLVCSVLLYAGLPLLYALRRSRVQFLLLYAHLAGMLAFGSVLGGLYHVPVTADLVLLPGELGYAGFLFAALVTIVLGRDLQVIRNVLAVATAVTALGLVIFALARAALTAPGAANPYGINPAYAYQEPLAVVLFAAFVVGELLLVLAMLELAKRRLPRALMGVVYPAVYVAVMLVHGLLTSLISGQPVGAELVDKLIVTVLFLPPLLLFVGLYRPVVHAFEDRPLHLRHLLSTSRDPLIEELERASSQLAEQRSLALATSASVGRVNATVERILDSATNTILIALDTELRITHFNVGAQALLGWTPQEVCGQGLEVLLPAEEIARHAAALGTGPDLADVVSLQMSVGARRDWQMIARDDVCPTVSMSVTEVIADGHVVGHVLSGEDVTSRLRVETAMMTALSREHDALVRLQEADRVKQELVSTVSHELRTPIASITGYTEMLYDGAYGQLSPEQVAALDRVLRNTARLEQLVDDLLVLERVEQAPLPLLREPVDLCDVIRGTKSIVAEMVRGRDLKFSVSLPANPVVVDGDRAALDRLVINLLSNAVKFTPGRGTIALRVVADAGQAWLTVADTGIGVPVEDADQVFARFFRSNEANALAIPGSGLGLSIVQAVVAGHGGEVSFASTHGEGTTVTVSLPLTAVAHDTTTVHPGLTTGLGTGVRTGLGEGLGTGMGTAV